jgi:hypothetical protein
MAIRMTWLPGAVAGVVLALLQLVLMPLLTYHGRGVRALASQDDAFLVSVAVFLAVLSASSGARFSGKSALWYSAYRALLWGGVTTLFFFEIWCCGILRWGQNPPSSDLHGSAVLVYFAIMWVISFNIFLVAGRRLPRQSFPS